MVNVVIIINLAFIFYKDVCLIVFPKENVAAKLQSLLYPYPYPYPNPNLNIKGTLWSFLVNKHNSVYIQCFLPKFCVLLKPNKGAFNSVVSSVFTTMPPPTVNQCNCEKPHVYTPPLFDRHDK